MTDVSPQHLDDIAQADALCAEAGRLYREGQFADAIPLIERSLTLRERALGSDHLDVATWLANLAVLHGEMGQYLQAAASLERALRIAEHTLEPDDPGLATLLNNLAMVHQGQGNYRQAEQFHKRALDIRGRALGPGHPDVAASLNNLALCHQAQGEYAKAAPLYEFALKIVEHALGPEHADIAGSLHNLAALHHVQGRYAAAESLYERALVMTEHLLGPDHPSVATSLNNLALLHFDQGSYARAEPLFERALHIRHRVFGPVHPEMATSMSNLALIYQAQGAHAKATELFEGALQVCLHLLGPDHPDVATALNNLALVLHDQGAYRDAERLHARALDIRERSLGENHPDVAHSLNNLASSHVAQHAYLQAMPLYERALRIRERMLGDEHPAVAASLNNLAWLDLAQGTTAQAEPRLERALRILEKALGTDHPQVVTLLHNLAQLAWSRDQVPRALDLLARGAAAREHSVASTLAVLPEPRKRWMLQAQRDEAEGVVSFHAHKAPGDTGALALALTAILRCKGRVLDEMASEQAALRRNLSVAQREELTVLQERRLELASRRLIASDPGHADAIRALAQDIERRERELSRTSSAFRAHGAPLTIVAVQARLPAGAALVEFVHYRRFDPDSPAQPWHEPRYLAYVIPPDGRPRWVALGEAAPIEAHVRAAHAALIHRSSSAREALRTLDEAIFAPVRRALGPIDHVLLSPDSALHLVPFAALIDENGQYLVDRMLITYVTSGRDLLRARDVARSVPLVLAASDHDVALPGVRSEAHAVQNHFADAMVHIGPGATKDKLTAAQGPRFVHVATHGFFRASSGSAVRPLHASRGNRDIEGPSSMPVPDGRLDIEDALDDAGLILAGADQAAATVTAREIAGIDLRGTRLAVLSACDTGIGDVARSEGVYGLRRALVVAGAETQVVSLWKVDDAATAELMDHYYGELRRGAGRSEALRCAQRARRDRERDAHPCDWAAFVAIGDEGPL